MAKKASFDNLLHEHDPGIITISETCQKFCQTVYWVMAGNQNFTMSIWPISSEDIKTWW